MPGSSSGIFVLRKEVIKNSESDINGERWQQDIKTGRLALA